MNLFADPKIDLVFRRVFASEPNQPLLVDLLNSMLELRDTERLTEVTLLDHEARMAGGEPKVPFADVQCSDGAGRTYIVEMQVLSLAAFEKRLVYQLAKFYTSQKRHAGGYGGLDDVIGMVICDFEIWPQAPESEDPAVPMLSHWRMQEQHGGVLGLPQMQYVFLELPKYQIDPECEPTPAQRWAAFFRDAESLEEIPPLLAGEPYSSALEAARLDSFTAEEWDAYESAKIAEEDARAAVALAEQEGAERGLAQGRLEGLAEGQELGRAEGLELGLAEGQELGRTEGLAEGLRRGIVDLCEAMRIPLDDARREEIAAMVAEQLSEQLESLKTMRRWA